MTGSAGSHQTAFPQRPRPASKDRRFANEDERTVVGPRPPLPGQQGSDKILLSDVIGRQTRQRGTASNPILSAAQGLLALLGVLRTGSVDMDGPQLHQKLMQDLIQFDQQARSLGVSEQDIKDARYALAATCDDIAQNLPGADQVYWRRNSLTAHFFTDPNAGVGFFTRLYRMSTTPSHHVYVLEVMYACLALGFEGQYRSAPAGQVALVNLRRDLYHRFRSFLPPPNRDISNRWTPVVLGGTRRHRLVPLWTIAGIGAAMVVSLYAVLAWTLTRDAQAAQSALIDLHDPADPIAIERITLPDPDVVQAPQVTAYEAPPTDQIERVRARLAAERAAGAVTVGEAGDFITIRLGAALQFGAGAAALDAESPILARIGALLEAEPGLIIVEGHTDDIPLSGRGRYKTNDALSAARAASVRDLLAQYVTDPARITVAGAGATKPLNRANTPQARSQNRRVDILLLKEQRL